MAIINDVIKKNRNDGGVFPASYGTVCAICARKLSLEKKIHPSKAHKELEGKLAGKLVYKIPGAKNIYNEEFFICENCAKEIMDAFNNSNKGET